MASCVVLVFRYDPGMRDFRFCRTCYIFFDALDRFRSCVDRRFAGCDSFASPVFRFCGLYFPARSAGAIEKIYGIEMLCKAFLFGFIALAMRTAFGDAGWVYQQLLMFSDICSLPVMYLFALRHPPERFRLHVGDGIFLLWGIAVAVIDYSLVSPYLAEL